MPITTEAVTDTPTPYPTPVLNTTPIATVAVSEDIVHILLIGGEGERIQDINTDTLIVAVVDKKARQVSLLSIPRDLWVHIPGHGWSRINRAYRLGNLDAFPDGGPALLIQTVQENLGIPIDHWIQIQMNGFEGVVDALGGVDVVVPCRLRLHYEYSDTGEVVTIYLEPGVHHLNGEEALWFVRTREDYGTHGRERRNQQFLKAVWNQTRSTDLVHKVSALWSALRDSFETDLSLGQVLALVPTALELDEERVRSFYLGREETDPWTTPEGWSVLALDRDKVQELVASLYLPPPEDPLASEAARIQVQNGTQSAQLELIVADQLQWAGLDVVETGPADHPRSAETEIMVFSDKPYSLALLSRLLEVQAEHIVQRNDPDSSVDIQVILGEDYDPCP
jgi:LCP family protein required for cell wall assembly